MNLNAKYQQTQVPDAQSNIHAQQVLLQQLQQGQSASAQPSQSSNANFGDMLNDIQANLYANSYARPLQGQQNPQLQNVPQQYFSQQFQQQQQPAILQLQFQQQPQQQQPQPQQQQQQQSQQQQNQQQQQHNQQQLGQFQQGQNINQLQSQPQQNQAFLSQQLFQNQTPKSINVDNPNSIYWQHQQQLCQVSRGSNMPHFYAKQYASNSRKSKNPYSEAKSVNLIDATKSIVSALEEQEKLLHKNNPSTNSALMQNKKIAQYYDDEIVQEEERMRQKTHGQQLWCQLDLSGQGLSNLSPKLFQYDFLESLYLNNNKLTTVPPIISKLRGLRTLDLSANLLNEVPSDLGLCYNLRYLYLFDNNIKTLPQGFGNLIELLFLGIEGNPMDFKLANLLAEKGTKELIAYLRDSPSELPKPQPRKWLVLEDDGEIIDETANAEAHANDALSKDSFTLMSYNMLCQHYATSKMHKYTPAWALEWEYRRSLLKDEIIKRDTDIVCMQEVETRTFQEFWSPLMQELGYKGVFYRKTRYKTMAESDASKVDGCCTFYKTSKFQLVQRVNFEYNSVCMGSDKYKKTRDLFNRFMNKDHIALITLLQHVDTGEKICVVTTHLHWDPAFNDVKALQVGILLEELPSVMKKLLNTSSLEEVKNTPLLICGDFNSTIDSAVYQLFVTGFVKSHEDVEGYDYGKLTEEGFRHVFKLKSSYDSVGELPFTNCTPGFTEVIDYIWYSPSVLQVKGLLDKVDPEYSKHIIGFPDANFPSDHIPLLAKFQIVKNSSTNKRPEFKPDFKTGSSRKT